MSWLGAKAPGSSRLPARIVTISGAPPGRPKSGEPQSPQNARVVVCPLSAVMPKYFGVPFAISKAVRDTATTGTNALPDSRWQSRQWQLRENSAGVGQAYRIAPHAQPPERVDIARTSVECSPVNCPRRTGEVSARRSPGD